MASRGYRGSYSNPERYLFGENERRDDQMRNLLNMFMMSKKMGAERGEQEREWKFKEEKRGMEQQDLTSMLELRGAQTERALRPPTPPVEKRSTMYQKALDMVKTKVAPSVGEAMSMLLKENEDPLTTYDKRTRDIKKDVESGVMSPEKGKQIQYNLKQELTPDERIRKGASIRDANGREIRDFFKTIPGLIDNKGRMISRKLRKIVGEKSGGLPLSSQGYRLDMPERYNRAVLNKRDRVATTENLDVIEKYDAMFEVFQNRLLKRDVNSFKKYMTSPTTKDLRNDPDFDNGQIKLWYDIFKK